MSVRISLTGLLRLIRIDTLRRVHNVGFLGSFISLKVLGKRWTFFIMIRIEKLTFFPVSISYYVAPVAQ